jgi:hypothetical protein
MKPAFRCEHVTFGCVEAHVPGADEQHVFLGHSESAKLRARDADELHAMVLQCQQLSAGLVSPVSTITQTEKVSTSSRQHSQCTHSVTITIAQHAQRISLVFRVLVGSEAFRTSSSTGQAVMMANGCVSSCSHRVLPLLPPSCFEGVLPLQVLRSAHSRRPCQASKCAHLKLPAIICLGIFDSRFL